MIQLVLKHMLIRIHPYPAFEFLIRDIAVLFEKTMITKDSQKACIYVLVVDYMYRDISFWIGTHIGHLWPEPAQDSIKANDLITNSIPII